ncbi:hypothetical protein D9M69_499790 [compost metagenome]
MVVAETVASVVLLETAVRLAKRSVEFRSLSAVWNSLIALLSWPTAVNFSVVAFSRRES